MSENVKSAANIILSNTQLAGFYETIDQIKTEVEKDKFQSIVLVVPDKFSLNAEQIFMERTGLSSVFNVWITTLSRLVSKVVADDANKFMLLTKNSGVMLVSKIIAQNKERISTYKKIADSYSLAETMYNAINLLKSSGVRPEELKNNFSASNFGLKIQDIYLVYSEYEKAMDGKIDAITRLQIFDKKVENDKYIHSSKIYFSMFDGFTNVQINSLCKLAKNAKQLSISLCANTLQSNCNIFDNTLFYRLTDYFKEHNIYLNIKNITSKVNARVDFLSKNMFAFDIDKKFQTEDVRLMECDNISMECRYVANRIKYLVMEKGYSFDDINVAINGIQDYELEIEKTFSEYDFPFYVDVSRTMLDHYFVKTFFKIANFVCGDKTMSNAIAISKSPIFEIEYKKKCDFDNICHKYNIFGDVLAGSIDIEKSEASKNAEEVRTFIFDDIYQFGVKLNKSKTVLEFTDTITSYFEKIKAKEILETISQNNKNIIQSKIDSEVYGKFVNVLSQSCDMLSDCEISKEMFFEMLRSALQSVNLLTVPLRTNAVFVGDASQSTYYPRKILFVMGATQTRMPSYQSDFGTITDSEIENFVASRQISPTIKELNKREKFKLFNLVLTAGDLLELTYSTLIAGEIQQQSEFVIELQKVVTKNGMPLSVQKFAMEELKIFEMSDPKLVAYLVGTTKNALKVMTAKDSKLKYLLERDFKNILLEQKKIFVEDPSRFNLENAKHYLFENYKTSISQVERYFKCPFMQFVDYAISPKEKERFELKASSVGSILHKVAEDFVNYYIKHNFKVKNIETASQNIFKKVISADDYKNLRTNNYFVSILQDESQRFCKAIKYHIDSSDFKPLFAEYHFQNYELSNGLTFSGYIDRIDGCDDLNAIRIIDYKSGSDKFSFKEIYYGIKLQLIAYLKVACDKLNKNGVGALYMPVKNKFGDMFDSEFKSYKLDGVFLNNPGTIKRMDKNLLESSTSEIISVSFSKSDEVNRRQLAHILTREEIEALMTYTFDVLVKALDEMIEGYIEPKPYFDGKTPCDFCKYKSLCHYEANKTGFREFTAKTKNSFESK